ncbi:MAG: DEAD/DEAH box helicase [Halobacteriaceae archaeon]
MDVADLPLDSALVEHYRERGVESLYPPQAAAVEAGLLDGESVLAAVPTASGKTLVAELAMATAGGTALYIVPLRALADEKGREFARLPGVEVSVATGDLDDPAVAAADVVVATAEKVDSLLRNEEEPFGDLGVVVVDELHLLDDASRGPTLEMTVATLRRRQECQVVALSATVGNAGALAEWLDAALVESEWRPVELQRGVYYDGQIAFRGAPVRQVGDGEPVPALVGDTVAEAGQALVFVRSRRAAEEVAADLAAGLGESAPGVAADIRETARTATGRALADAAEGGVAFHHAGLRPAHRQRVEAAYRERDLAAIAATTTLAAGVNLPARRVVVRDHRRFTDDGWTPLPVLEVHQMFGRAGRPGLDPQGEAVLVAEDYEEATALHERYIEADHEPVTSKLATQEALRTHVLAAVATGLAGSRDELLALLGETFYAAEEERGTLVDIADLVLDYLESEGMVARDAGATALRATGRGEAVSRSYVDPETGAAFVAALQDLEAWEAVEPVTVLEAVCATPDMATLYFREEDRAPTLQFATANESRLLVDLADFDGEFEQWLHTVKTVRVLAAYLGGADEEALTDEYGIGPGDLRTVVERAEWLVGAFATLADHEGSRHADAIREVADAVEERADGAGD